MALFKKHYKKLALALSLCLIVIWTVMGAGTSLAWFTDTDEEVKNVFHFAEFDLAVSHRLEDGTYEEIKPDTKIFDDEALYEPGYVQVVYLKVENKGTVPFDFKTAVSVSDYTPATNVFGQTFNLQDYLKFGVVSADTEALLEEKLADRELAVNASTMKLNNYSTDSAELEAGGETYLAIIVRMPEEVGNDANYREDKIPKVELGIIVSATQKKNTH